MFDCETVPDIELIRKNFDVKGDEFEAIRMALSEYEKNHGTTFLPLPYHKIVAISAVIADEFGNFERVNTIKGADERQMLEGFLNFIDRKNPKLVSYNGRAFDLPLMMLRAMKYNLSCPGYFEEDNKSLNKNRWNNYKSRYSENFHADLLDSLGNYGAVRGMKLDTICQMAGIPGKYDVSGDMVLELYYKGELEKIYEYCESDVLNTYLLYLKYELLKGNLSFEDYINILDKMAPKIPDKGYREVFLDFIKRETDGSGS